MGYNKLYLNGQGFENTLKGGFESNQNLDCFDDLALEYVHIARRFRYKMK